MAAVEAVRSQKVPVLWLLAETVNPKRWTNGRSRSPDSASNAPDLYRDKPTGGAWAFVEPPQVADREHAGRLGFVALALPARDGVRALATMPA
jgi:hypothetical protein